MLNWLTGPGLVWQRVFVSHNYITLNIDFRNLVTVLIEIVLLHFTQKHLQDLLVS